MTRYVFQDPSGKRSRNFRLLCGFLAALILVLFAIFATTLAFAPYVPEVRFRDPKTLSALNVRIPHRGRPWSPLPNRPHAKGSNPRPISVGFYVNWDADSFQSLREHLAELDVIAPQWITVSQGDGHFDFAVDSKAEDLFHRAPKRPNLMPVIHNAVNGVWVTKPIEQLLLSKKAHKAFIDNLQILAKQYGFSGYIFDFENLSPKALMAYPQFITEVNVAFNESHREVWVTVPVDDSHWPLKALQDAADTLVPMVYDEHWQTARPGPIAGQNWFQTQLSKTLKNLDPNKIVLALGAYGYDWTHGQKEADPVNFHEAIQAAHDSNVSISFDQKSLNPTFRYADDKGQAHEIWFLDAATFYNQIKSADAWRPRGYAFWRLGSEDPGLWQVWGRRYDSASSANLSQMPASHNVDFDGYGEVLRITAQPTPGRRRLFVDKINGLVTNEIYDVFPTAWIVQRLGQRPGKVALTFDDGPDPRWTPKILDILKAKQVPATFFVIGRNMEDYPEIVVREVEEGHIVGSHTYTHPNIADEPASAIPLEFNLTQRLFQTITGRSMRFFRPPYLGDASPSTAAELLPLLTAQKLGYVTVGLRIDPDDWNKPNEQLIISRTLSGLADTNPETGGQVVLLHDSGGNRQRTINALPGLIDALRAKGFQFVSVAGLLEISKDQAMPLAQRDVLGLWLDRIIFTIVRDYNKFINTMFFMAILVGLARLFFLSILALYHRFRLEHSEFKVSDSADQSLVSILIPCFNESAVIVASIRHILRSSYENIEILIIDDGSTDGTSDVVEQHYGNHPKVRCLRFPNGGKAVALNQGLSRTKGEIIIALDADTLFGRMTIERLVYWFSDPKLAAVAGNALVGNQVNVVTRWQALEYVSAQNLERRALSALGTVTVVPGAVGAWRKTALEALGGFPDNTLAEDQDLTLAAQSAGWKVEFDPEAVAFTEAPQTVRGLLRQRFRWSFGTLQCVWKHRGDLFNVKRPALGFIALPQIWLFQIFLTSVSPLIDLAVIFSLISAIFDRLSHPVQWNSEGLTRALFYWTAFVLVDLAAAVIGMAMERRAPWQNLWWLPAQRFGYRQLMYYVVVKAIFSALQGRRVEWGSLQRTAKAVVDEKHDSKAVEDSQAKQIP